MGAVPAQYAPGLETFPGAPLATIQATFIPAGLPCVAYASDVQAWYQNLGGGTTWTAITGGGNGGQQTTLIVNVATAAAAGGSLTFTTSGLGLSPNIPSVASASSQFWAKGIIRAESIKNCPNGFGIGLLNIDSDGAFTNPKIEAYIQIPSAGNFNLVCRAPTLGSATTPTVGNGTFAGLTTGHDVTWMIGWQGTPNASLQCADLWDTTGTPALVTDGTNTASVSASALDGALITTGGANGRVMSNKSFHQVAQQAIQVGGLACYSSLVPASGNAARYSIPQITDSGIVYFCNMGDAQTGTVPSTTACQVGGSANGLVLSGTYAWAPDTSTAGWNFVAGGNGGQSSFTIPHTGTVQLSVTTYQNGLPLTGRTYTWASNNTGVATVNGTGLVTGVAIGSVTITATDTGVVGLIPGTCT